MRLFRNKNDEWSSVWKRLVDLALTDVRFLAQGGIVDESLEALEERLLSADFGVKATLQLVGEVEQLARRGKIGSQSGLREALRETIGKIIQNDAPVDLAESEQEGTPTVYLFVGVNGVGKTTSIAKLAHAIREGGRSVLIGAADTFRAGAVQQLEHWASTVGADFVRGVDGGDPAAVAFDSVQAAISRSIDVVLLDTAGRLQTNAGLMEELRKVKRVVARQADGAPHEILMVIDATVGQNALSQVRTFHEVLGLTGIVLAKLDSTASGGIVVALRAEHGIPVKLVGLGEAVTDLESFDADTFLDGVFSKE